MFTLTKHPQDVDRAGQAGDEARSPNIAAGGFMVPVGLTYEDLRNAALLIDDWDWENVYGTGLDDEGPFSSIELVAKVYDLLLAAAARNLGS